MTEIKSERTNPGRCLSCKYPISSQTNGSRRHPSFVSIHSSSQYCFPGPSNPTPVATIQSARGFSHLAFQSSCPIDVGRVGILPSSSGRSQVSFLALSKLGCMHRKNTSVSMLLLSTYPFGMMDVKSE
jgi:hypothetical protein